MMLFYIGTSTYIIVLSQVNDIVVVALSKFYKRSQAVTREIWHVSIGHIARIHQIFFCIREELLLLTSCRDHSLIVIRTPNKYTLWEQWPSPHAPMSSFWSYACYTNMQTTPHMTEAAYVNKMYITGINEHRE